VAEKSSTLLYLAPLDDGTLRKNPVDIFSDEPARGGGRKRKNLTRLGVDQEHAFAWSRIRIALAFTNSNKNNFPFVKGGWTVSHL